MSAEVNTSSTNNNDVETPPNNVFEEEEGQVPLEEELDNEREEWSTWKKVAVALVALVAIGLAIGLPLAFLRNDKGGDNDSSATDGPTIPSNLPTTESPSISSPTTTSSPSTISPTATPTDVPTNAPTITPTIASTVTTLPPVSTETVCPDEYYYDTSSALLPNATYNKHWNPIAPDITGEDALDFSGAALALSAAGTIVAIASTENDNPNGRNAGQVRVYQLQPVLESENNNTLPFQARFQQLGQDIDGAAPSDWSGESISMDARGHRLAVGAGWNDGMIEVDQEERDNSNVGHVRIWDYNSTTAQWNLLKDLVGQEERAEFGKSVSLSADGTRLAVGASHCRGRHNRTRVGCVYVLDYNSTTGDWMPLEQELEGLAEGDEFGTVVVLSLEGSHLAVGAYRHDVGGPNGTTVADAGQVSLYRYNTTTHSFQPNGVIKGVMPSEWAGMALALSQNGRRVVMGFYSRPAGPGYARVYEQLDDGSWAPIGSKDLRGGFSVSISRDGSRVAVGDNQGRSNGANAGFIHVYDYNGLEWKLVGTPIHGNPQEMAGIAVALSADGQRVAFTAPFASSFEGVPQVGATRVYDWCSSKDPTHQELEALSSRGGS